MPEIRTCPDTETLALTAAEHFVGLALTAISARGQFSVSLSGGSTPRPFYRLLAGNEFTHSLDWGRIHLFFGDERCVPKDDPDSNYRMVRESLLDHIPIPPENVYRIQGENEAGAAASEYEKTLRAHSWPATGHGDTETSFDLVLLGMGTDGHTASLFPGTGVIHERRYWVVAYYVDKLESWRVTLTPEMINKAAQVTFIVSGNEKAEPLKQVLQGPYQPDLLPSQIVKPVHGDLLWLLDSGAASRL